MIRKPCCKNHWSTPQERPVVPNLVRQKATFRMCRTWSGEEGGKEGGERRGDVGWTAGGGRMSNESETSGERRKRIARPPLRTRRKGNGRADEGRREQRAVYTIKGS